MSHLAEVPPWISPALAFLGLLLNLAGYRSIRMMARISSAAILSAAGLLVGLRLDESDPLLAVVVSAGLGGVGYALGDIFYYLKVVLSGAAAGFVLGVVAGELAGHSGSHYPPILGAAVGALLAYASERPVGILATSIVGATLITLALVCSLGNSALAPWDRHRSAYLLVLAGFTILGTWVQWRTRERPSARAQAA